MRTPEDIYLAALEIADPLEREGFVARACAGEASLRKKVDALFREAGRAAEYFADFERAASATDPGALPDLAGTVIGRYKLLQKIGEGGMGEVWMAAQSAPVARKVALKIIKPGMDTKHVIARFEAERQALALMDHPNIARVLDGGVIGDTGSEVSNPSRSIPIGRPYFVMELVQGIPITQFCNDSQLTIRERIRLLIPVCQAIQSAHQKGVIHRDLKPSNILVTLNAGEPHPMVIDFGVAKAVNQRLTEKTLFTQFATLIGTPAYMSPEQAEMSRQEADTRSDIYSLGVLLYELLTGTTPFPDERLRSAGYGEMQRILTQEEPERPSSRLSKTRATAKPTPPRNAHAASPDMSSIDADLDWIVMKCLEKDPGRRYESASGFADDMRRFLDNEPVSARPPSLAYRFGKLTRRNRTMVMASAISLLALISAVVLSSWQAVRATRAERRATAQAELSRAVRDFLKDQLLGTSNPFNDPSPDPNKRPLLDRIARQLEGKFHTQPEIEAELRNALGQAYRDLWEMPAAIVQFQHGLDACRRAHGNAHDTTLEALAELSYTLVYAGRLADARRLVDEALAAPGFDAHRRTRGNAAFLMTRGTLLFRNDESKAALPYVQEALSIAMATHGPDDPFTFNCRGMLNYVLDGAGQSGEAIRSCTALLEEWRQKHGDDDPNTFSVERNLAEIELWHGQWQAAMPRIEHTLAAHARVFGSNYFGTLDCQYLLAWACEQKGDVEAVARLFRAQHAGWERYLPADLAKHRCLRIAKFFRDHDDLGRAQAICRPLVRSIEQGPTQWAWEPRMHAEAASIIGGWPAAAAVWRRHLDHTNEPSLFLRDMARIFLFTGDPQSHREISRVILESLPRESSFARKKHAVEIAMLAPDTLAPSESQQVDKLALELRSPPALADGDLRKEAHWALCLFHLRGGRFAEALAQCDPAGISPELKQVIQAMCLHRQGRSAEARSLLASLPPPGNPRTDGPFPPAGQLPFQILLREARSSIGLD